MADLLLAVEWNKDGIGVCDFATAFMMAGITVVGLVARRKKVAG